MKTKLPLLFLALLAAGVIGAALPQRIRWTWHNGRSIAIVGVWPNQDSIEIGLRDDGVVVWREITTTTNAIVVTTNSPAEREDSGVMILTNTYHLPYFQWTNEFVPFTNFWWYSGTNNIVPL